MSGQRISVQSLLLPERVILTLKEKDVLYEQHRVMRVSISCWTPLTDPSRTVMGISEEDDTRIIWVASTNSIAVSAALRNFVHVTRGLNVSFSGPYPEQATHFSVQYDKSLWSAIDVRDALLDLITKVNVQPKQRRGPKTAKTVEA